MMVGSWGTGQSKKKVLNWGAEPVNKALGRLVRGPISYSLHTGKSPSVAAHTYSASTDRGRSSGISPWGSLASQLSNQ